MPSLREEQRHPEGRGQARREGPGCGLLTGGSCVAFRSAAVWAATYERARKAPGWSGARLAGTSPLGPALQQQSRRLG